MYGNEHEIRSPDRGSAVETNDRQAEEEPPAWIKSATAADHTLSIAEFEDDVARMAWEGCPNHAD